MPSTLETLTASPEYKELLAKRKKLVWPLLVLTVGAYFAFILTIAFSPKSLGQPFHEGGVVSIGIVLGLALILFNFVITLLYVRGANRTIEPIVARIQMQAGEK